MLTIKDLNIFDEHTDVLVENASFDCYPGKITGVVGESGSGKTLTMLAVMGLLPNKINMRSQAISWYEQDLTLLSEKEYCQWRGNKVSMIFQDPMNAFNPLHTVGRQIAEMLKVHRYNNDIKKKVLNLLKEVEFDNPETIYAAYPHELSGGQQQRALIAMAIANNPEILIADEPTTALDSYSKNQILDLLKKVMIEHDMCLIIVSHDIASIMKYADQLVVMRSGQVLEFRPTEEILMDPQVAYTQSLLEPRPCLVENTVSEEQALTVKDLTVRFKTSKVFSFETTQQSAIKSMSFDLKQGECLGVIGQSGAGKTTLAKSLLKLLPIDGEILLKGLNWSQLSQRACLPYRHKIQMVFQNPFASLSPRMNVFEIIAEGLIVQKTFNIQTIRERVIKVMEAVQLDPQTQHKYPHEFSGGQRQRIAIARSLVLEPDILILDEPTASLDRIVGDAILALLAKIQQNFGISYLLVSHDMSVIQSLSHRVMVIDKGSIIDMGTLDALRGSVHEVTRKMLI